jgi:hypothetical protein
MRRAACSPECLARHAEAKECPVRRSCAYVLFFEPHLILPAPSGFADLPRPYVLRAAHLDGRTIPSGDSFTFDMHLFDVLAPPTDLLARAASRLCKGAVLKELNPVEPGGVLVRLPLDLPRNIRVRRVEISFVTPTELKSEGAVQAQPEFCVLFARIRDRICALRQLYGEGSLDIDHRGMAERAAAVSITHSRLEWQSADRRSSRTGQRHALGGFVGSVAYEGELTEFVPWLEAAYWTGVGRHTVWGKGVLRVVSKAP